MKIALMVVGFVFFGVWVLIVTIIMLTDSLGMILLLNPFIFLSYFGSIATAVFLYWKMGAPQKVE